MHRRRRMEKEGVRAGEIEKPKRAIDKQDSR